MSTTSEHERSVSQQEHNTVNVAARLAHVAAKQPEQVAIAMPARRGAGGKRHYHTITFAELERDTNRIASGLLAAGAKQGMRLVLLVRPSIDFIALVFAMLKAGVVIVLIDPGMGRRNLIRCLAEARPEGFIAISPVHAVRTLLAGRFPQARFNVTVGRRWFWGGYTLDQIRELGNGKPICAATDADDPAAIIFTSGSTGAPKGVLYHHDVFDQQVEQIRDEYDIQPGEVDLPAFPLFGLFNAAMGVTTVIPKMDFTRPARADPREIIETINDWNVTQSFGSPAFWNVVGRHCEANDVRMRTLRRVLSAGAPVPPDVLRRVSAAIADDGEIHTPYGATEALPVATISAAEVLGNARDDATTSGTAARSEMGAGTCVGRRYAGIEWRIIRITDEPLAAIDQAEPLPVGEIGELIVRGRVVTRQYVTRTEANALYKIADEPPLVPARDAREQRGGFWHRMGDIGYLDEADRFWFCGRKSHRVITPEGTLFTVPCEAIFNRHAAVFRSALVGVGPAGNQTPVILVELEADRRRASHQDLEKLKAELLELGRSHEMTAAIGHLLFHPSFPVDIRHNAKIFREKLAIWATGKITLSGE